MHISDLPSCADRFVKNGFADITTQSGDVQEDTIRDNAAKYRRGRMGAHLASRFEGSHPREPGSPAPWGLSSFFEGLRIGKAGSPLCWAGTFFPISTNDRRDRTLAIIIRGYTVAMLISEMEGQGVKQFRELGSAFLLSAAIGLEREIRHKSA